MKQQAGAKVQKTAASPNPLQKRAQGSPSSGHPLLELQRTIGNSAIQLLIRSPHIQTKLQISTPEDPQEQKADDIVKSIMKMPDPNIDRKGTHPQAKPVGSEITPIVQRKDGEFVGQNNSEFKPLNGVGDPLPLSTRAFFEPRFGVDFSRVRVHTDSRAAKTARFINAKAFTVGTNIAFATGQYAPDSSEGKKILAHELTHVIQQGAGSIQKTIQRQPNQQVTNDEVLAAMVEDTDFWESELKSAVGSDRAYAQRVVLLLAALPEKTISSVKDWNEFRDECVHTALDEKTTLEDLIKRTKKDEHDLLLNEGAAFPETWADKISREMRGAVNLVDAIDGIERAKKVAVATATDAANNIWERGLPLTLAEARVVTDSSIVEQSLDFQNAKTAGQEPIGRYAIALIEWAKANAYHQLVVSYLFQIKSRIGMIRRGELIVDTETYKDLLGIKFLEFKLRMFGAATSPSDIGRSMAALMLQTPSKFYRDVMGGGLKYEWPAEGVSLFKQQIAIVDSRIGFSFLPEQKIWRAIVWAHERSFFSAAGEEVWESIKDNWFTMLAMAVLIIVLQTIPGVNIAVDLALIVMFGLSILDTLYNLAILLKDVILTSSVISMEHGAARLATILVGQAADLFITAATWGVGKALKYMSKLRKAEKYINKYGDTKETRDALFKAKGDGDAADKLLTKQREQARQRAELEAAEKRRLTEQAERKLQQQEAAAEKQRQQEAAAAQRKQETEAAAAKKKQEAEAAAAKRKQEQAESAARKKREKEVAEQEAAKRKQEREEAAAKRKQEKEEAEIKRKLEKEEAAARKKQEEEDAAARKKMDEEDAARRRAAEKPLQEKYAANLEEIKKIDPEIKKHEQRRKDYNLKADRILEQRATLDFRDKAAIQRQHAANETRLRDEWQAKRNKLNFENDAIRKEIQTTRIGPRPSQPHGGAYRDVPTAGGEVNHIPPQSVLPNHVTKYDGPSIWMEIADHKRMNSTGASARRINPTDKYPYKTTGEWRAAQAELIKKGKFREAMQMDIDDIVAKCGAKYDRGIKELLEYFKKLNP